MENNLERDLKEKQGIDRQALKEELRLRIRDFYPYFLGFYILCLLIALFSENWRELFYWPGLHGSFIFFTLIFLATFKLSKFSSKLALVLKQADEEATLARPGVIANLNGLRTPAKESSRFLYHFLVSTSAWLSEFGRRVFFALFNRLKALSFVAWLKILTIALVLVVAIFKSASAWELITILYALISVLYILDSRWSAGVALLYLASCPVLLFLDRGALAESAAVYAFYFLVITVLTQLQELRREERSRPGEKLAGEVEELGKSDKD